MINLDVMRPSCIDQFRIVVLIPTLYLELFKKIKVKYAYTEAYNHDKK